MLWMLAAILVSGSLTAHAEEHGELPQWVRNIKLSGYGMLQYQTTYEDEYEEDVNYFFNKNMQLNLEYAYVNDRTQDRHNYNIVDVQLDFRF